MTELIQAHAYNGWFVVFGIMAIVNLARGHWVSALLLCVATVEFGVRPLINT